MPLNWPDKYPDEVLDYQIDWVPYLGADTISTSTWTIPAGITKDSDSHTSTSTTISLSGGVSGVTYEFLNQIVTAGGRTSDQSVRLKILPLLNVIVENGTGVAGANSYQSVATWKVYATQQGWDYSAYSDDQIASALIRATTWLDATYGARFPGVQTYEAIQSLRWPRKAGSIYYGRFVASGYLTTVVDTAGWPIAIDVIPVALIKAHVEATWREMVEPGVLAPDLERGGAIKSVKASSVDIEWFGNAPPVTKFSIIDGMLAGLLIGLESGGYTARAVRA